MVRRRAFLKKSGGAFPVLTGTGIFGSAQSRQQQQWDLPIDQVEERKAPAESYGFTGEEEDKEIKQNKVLGNSNGVSQFELEAFCYGTGTLGMAGSTTFGTMWEAPESGEYTLTANYWGNGTYFPGASDPWELDIDTAGTGEVNLAVVNQRESVVGKQTQVQLGSALDPRSEEAFEKIIGFLAKRLITAYFGFIGGLIATFLMYAFEPNLQMLRSKEFWIEPLEGREIDVTFTARAGETYDIFFTPCIGFGLESREGPYPPYGPRVGAKYNLNSLRIEKGDDGLF
jgi:hypothetical protein